LSGNVEVNVPILAVDLEYYDDFTDIRNPALLSDTLQDEIVNSTVVKYL